MKIKRAEHDELTVFSDLNVKRIFVHLLINDCCTSHACSNHDSRAWVQRTFVLSNEIITQIRPVEKNIASDEDINILYLTVYGP